MIMRSKINLHLRLFCLFFVLLFGSSNALHAGLVHVGFGSGPFLPLGPATYTEDGFTFSELFGSAFLDGDTDRYLGINLPTGPTMTGARMQSAQRFDFQSFQVEGFVARNWKVISSSGGLLTISHGSSPGVITLSSNSDWQDLTHVDFIHDENGANASIHLDNFNMISPTVAAPEPSSFAYLAVVIPTMIVWSKVRHRSRSNALPTSSV